MVSSTETEGQYVSARLTDDAVRLVTTTGMPAVPLPDTGTAQYDANGMVDPAWQREWVKSSRAALAEASGDDFLPRRVVRSPSGEVVSTAPAFDCAALSHPEDQSGLGTVTVTTLDPMADGDDLTVDATGVSADGDMVYASTDRLYVATTRGGWGIWDGGVQGPDSGITTELHGFDTTSTDGTPYLASGEVEGWLLGRWALSAEDGMLRVATTRDGPVAGQGQDVQPQAPGTDSAVTILAEGDGTLEQVGQVTGLGKGEQIRAVRWFGDTATVVTFRQTDPLYVVDLSDPAKPTVTGELKVPGYSAYLHPIGDDVLLGVGTGRHRDRPDDRHAGLDLRHRGPHQADAPRRPVAAQHLDRGRERLAAVQLPTRPAAGSDADAGLGRAFRGADGQCFAGRQARRRGEPPVRRVRLRAARDGHRRRHARGAGGEREGPAPRAARPGDPQRDGDAGPVVGAGGTGPARTIRTSAMFS